MNDPVAIIVCQAGIITRQEAALEQSNRTIAALRAENDQLRAAQPSEAPDA